MGEKEIYKDMNIWIEKTIIHNRPDRIKDDYALGKALWSPQTDKRGADIYKSMRLIMENDVILQNQAQE